MVKYRAEIDGLRTVAVIPVIVFHLGYGFVKGGFWGVDVFFVISGYLITKVLTDDIENGNFSMYRFWLRRVKRLLPLLLTVILITLIITPFLVFKPVVKDISKDIFPALFSYSNFHALYDFGDYWGGEAKQSFFLHTWSLSVEEQFYLLYPFFLFFAYKYFKNLVIPILTITITSVFIFFFYTKIINKIDTAFYMLHTRIWELSIGGYAGLMISKYQNIKVSKYRNIFPIIGISFIAFSYLFGNRILYLLPVLGSSLIILFCTPNDIVGKVLSTKLFVFIGKISYSLYLWHWCVIKIFENLSYQFQQINHHLINGLILLLTFLLAYLSNIFIENKTRNYKHTPRIVLAGIALIVGLTFYFQSDFYRPYYNSKYNQLISYDRYYSTSPTLIVQKENESLWGDSAPIWKDVIRLSRLPKFNEAYKNEGIITNKKNGVPKIILIGDSHGAMWAKLLNEISEELNITLSCYVSNGNNPFFNIENVNCQEKTNHFTEAQRVEYAKSVIGNIEKWEPKIVVLACRWEHYVNNKQFNELLEFLEKRNINVLLLNQPPVLNFMKEKNAGQYFTYLGLNPVDGYNFIEVNDQLTVTKGNDYLKSLVTKYRNVYTYDVNKNMTENNKVKISLHNDVFYFDDDHLSIYGTYEHRKNISDLIKTILK